MWEKTEILLQLQSILSPPFLGCAGKAQKIHSAMESPW